MISVHAVSSRRAGPPLGAGRKQRGQRFGQPLERPLGPGRRLLDIDPVGRHAHQQVGPGAGTQLALPRRETSVGGTGQVRGQRGDLEPVVVLDSLASADHSAEPRLGHQVVGAVHPEDRVRRRVRPSEVAVEVGPLVDPLDERLGVVGHDRRRCRSPGGGTRPGPRSRRAPATRRRCGRRPRARPRHTTAWSNPNWRSSWGIWATWPNMSGR